MDKKEDKKIKIIYSRKMARFLIKNGCVVIKTIAHPYKENFVAWVFEDTDDLRKYMTLYNAEKE